MIAIEVLLYSLELKKESIKVGDTIKFMATGATYEVTELGVRTPA